MPKTVKGATVRQRQNGGAALAKRERFLLSHLGFDPRDGVSLRAMASSYDAPMTGASLAADPAAAVAMINASPYVREPLTVEGVHVHTVEAASTRYIADRYAFLSARTVANIADDCRRGIAFMTKHATGGAFEGPGENPYGRTFAGQLDQRDGISRALVQFYMLRTFTPNGSSAASTDDIHRGLLAGTFFDFSTGLVGGGVGRKICDVCGNELFSMQCCHCPGSLFGMTDPEIAAQVARGVPEGKATYTFDDCHAGELSLVFNGAIPGASTAFSTRSRRLALLNDEPTAAAADMTGDSCQCCDSDPNCKCSTNDNGECSCTSDCSVCADKGCDGSTDMASQEEPMFTTEFKIAHGLTAAATDAEVEAKLNADSTRLAALSTENETLKANQKKEADLRFEAAWTGKLSAARIESLKGLANRDAMAAEFAAELEAAAKGKTVVAPPPIGDPLKGAGLAAAPANPQAKDEPEESVIFRKALGKFKTKDELVKFATIGPIEALEKWLSTSGTAVTLTREPLHENFERMTKDNRRAMLGIEG